MQQGLSMSSMDGLRPLPFLSHASEHAGRFLYALEHAKSSRIYDMAERNKWSQTLNEMCSEVDKLAVAIHTHADVKAEDVGHVLSQLKNITARVSEKQDAFSKEILDQVHIVESHLLLESSNIRRSSENVQPRNDDQQSKKETISKTNFLTLAALGILTALSGGFKETPATFHFADTLPDFNSDLPDAPESAKMAQFPGGMNPLPTTEISTDPFLLSSLIQEGNYTGSAFFEAPDTTQIKAALAFTSLEDINKPHENGLTLLQMAVRGNRPELVRILLAQGAASSITATIPGELSPWQEAIVHGRYGIVKQLMEFLPESHSIDRPDVFGVTDLQRAARTGDIDLIQLLLNTFKPRELVENRDAYVPKGMLEALQKPLDIQAVLAYIPIDLVATPICVIQNFGAAMIRMQDGSILTLDNVDARIVFDEIERRRYGRDTTEGYNELVAYLNPGHAFLRLRCLNCDEGETHDANIGFYPSGKLFKSKTLAVETRDPQPNVPVEIAEDVVRVSTLDKITISKGIDYAERWSSASLNIASVSQEVVKTAFGRISQELPKISESSLHAAEVMATAAADITQGIAKLTFQQIHDVLLRIPEITRNSMEGVQFMASMTANVSETVANATYQYIQEELSKMPEKVRASFDTAKVVAEVTASIADAIAKSVFNLAQEEAAKTSENILSSVNTAKLAASVAADLTEAIAKSTIHHVQEAVKQAQEGASASLNSAEWVASISADLTEAIAKSMLHHIQEKASAIHDSHLASLYTTKLVASVAKVVTGFIAKSIFQAVQSELSQIPGNVQTSINTAVLVASLSTSLSKGVAEIIMKSAFDHIVETLKEVPKGHQESLETLKLTTLVINDVGKAVQDSIQSLIQEEILRIPEQAQQMIDMAKLSAAITYSVGHVAFNAAEAASQMLLQGVQAAAGTIVLEAPHLARESVKLLSELPSAAIRVKKSAGKVKRTFEEYYHDYIVDNYVMLKDQQGRVANEDTYEGMSHRENLLKMTFYLENEAAKSALQRIDQVTASCYGEGSPEDCRYYLLSRNCVDFVQGVYHATGASGHIGDYLLESQIRRQDITSLGKLFQYKAVNYAAISSQGLKEFVQKGAWSTFT